MRQLVPPQESEIMAHRTDQQTHHYPTKVVFDCIFNGVAVVPHTMHGKIELAEAQALTSIYASVLIAKVQPRRNSVIDIPEIRQITISNGRILKIFVRRLNNTITAEIMQQATLRMIFMFITSFTAVTVSLIFFEQYPFAALARTERKIKIYPIIYPFRR